MILKVSLSESCLPTAAHLKPNANKNKHHNELQAERTSAYLDRLDEDINKERLNQGKKPLTEPKRCQLKNVKVGNTDADSGFITRDNKPQGFFYLDHRTVDGKHGIILDSYATPGNVHDAQPYITRLDHTLTTFNLWPMAVGLDAGYSVATVTECLKRRDILAVFGYRRPMRTKKPLHEQSKLH